MGLPGAYVSELLLQTFGLAIVLVPVELITGGVRILRTNHIGFLGLRLSLLLLDMAWIARPPALHVAWPLLALWLAAPFIAYSLSRPVPMTPNRGRTPSEG